MANAPNTGSTLDFDGKNKTSTSISTNIIIMVENIPIGAIQTISVNEAREVRFINEIGTDGHIDSVPTSSVNISGDCNRIRFDRLRITEAFGRGFIHLASQTYPFDITIFDKQKANKAEQITTVIKNVWIKSLGTTYSATDWIIAESMSWEAEAIYSYMGTNYNNVAVGGERKNPVSIIDIERQTDIGLNGRRGSLDASGLIDLAKTYENLF